MDVDKKNGWLAKNDRQMRCGSGYDTRDMEEGGQKLLYAEKRPGSARMTLPYDHVASPNPMPTPTPSSSPHSHHIARARSIPYLQHDTALLLPLARARQERSPRRILEHLTDTLARLCGTLEIVARPDLLHHCHALFAVAFGERDEEGKDPPQSDRVTTGASG